LVAEPHVTLDHLARHADVIRDLINVMPAGAPEQNARAAKPVDGRIERFKGKGAESSRYAARARLLETPPSVDRGEITDKGYINQRAVLSHRLEDLALLNGDEPATYIACGEAQ